MEKEKIIVEATKRSVIGKQVRALRREGKMPAVVYGKHIQPMALTLDAREGNRILSKVGSSHLITLKVDGDEMVVLLRDKQRDFIRGGFVHVDFQAVSMTETLRTWVRLDFVGSAPAVTDLNGILVMGESEVEVECLPKDLPEVIRVDISVLDKIGSSLHVRDVVAPEGVTILSNPGEMLVNVALPAGEESAMAALAGGGEEPEVMEKGKKEKEED